jgi:hypothetical protein
MSRKARSTKRERRRAPPATRAGTLEDQGREGAVEAFVVQLIEKSTTRIRAGKYMLRARCRAPTTLDQLISRIRPPQIVASRRAGVTAALGSGACIARRTRATGSGASGRAARTTARGRRPRSGMRCPPRTWCEAWVWRPADWARPSLELNVVDAERADQGAIARADFFLASSVSEASARADDRVR